MARAGAPRVAMKTATEVAVSWPDLPPVPLAEATYSPPAAPPGSRAGCIGDRIIAELCADLPADSPHVIASADRPGRLREIEAKLYALELVEELLVMPAQAQGLDVQRRVKPRPGRSCSPADGEEAVRRGGGMRISPGWLRGGAHCAGGRITAQHPRRASSGPARRASGVHLAAIGPRTTYAGAGPVGGCPVRETTPTGPRSLSGGAAGSRGPVALGAAHTSRPPPHRASWRGRPLSGGFHVADPVSRVALAKAELDRVFGSNYAQQHPEVLAVVVQSASFDYAALAIARGLQEVAAALAEPEIACCPGA